MTRLGTLTALCAVLLALAPLTGAEAAEAPSHPFRYEISLFEPVPKLVEDLEGPCGLAVDSLGEVYVANYYHDQIDAFGPAGNYISRMLNEEPLDGPCALAVDPAGDLYVDNLHRGVLRFALAEFPPAPFPRNGLTSGPATTIATGHSTGLALDPTSGDLFVDDRTYIAEYKAPIFEGEAPVRIGEGSLGEGFGLAVSGFAATEGLLYVPDAADGTVKVYDPSLEPAQQLIGEIDGAGTPQGGFASLHDAAVAVDDSDGHVFVTDNLQSLDYEHPRAAVAEFNPAGDYRGSLPPIPELFASEPDGLAIDNSGGTGQGDVYVTSGNSELAKVYAYGPTGPARTLTVTSSGTGGGTVRSEPAGIACPAACGAEYDEGATVTLSAQAGPGSAFVGWSGECSGNAASCEVAMTQARSVGAEFEALPPGAAESGSGSGTGEPGQAAPAGGPAGESCGPGVTGGCAEGLAVTPGASLPAAPVFRASARGNASRHRHGRHRHRHRHRGSRR